MIKQWHWEITRRCNLRCLHCITGDIEVTAEMQRGAMLNVVRRMSDLGGERLCITGGEPLTCASLVPVLNLAISRGMEVELLTNGTLLDASFLRTIKGQLKRIGISLDGTKQSHDFIRGKGNYSKTISSLSLLVSENIPFSVFITLNSLNRGSLVSLVREAARMGAMNVHINSITAYGRAAKNPWLLLPERNNPEEEAKEIFSQLDRWIEVGEVTRKDQACSIRSDTAYVNSAGNVFACSEQGILDPKSPICSMEDRGFLRKMKEYFALTYRPGFCRYALFEAQGVSLTLEEPRICPLLGGANEKRS